MHEYTRPSKEQRRDEIWKARSVLPSVANLASWYQVEEGTIRKDLQALKIPLSKTGKKGSGQGSRKPGGDTVDSVAALAAARNVGSASQPPASAAPGEGSRSRMPAKLPPHDVMKEMMRGLMPADGTEPVEENLLGACAYAGLMDDHHGAGLQNWVRRATYPSTREGMTDAQLVFEVRSALTDALRYAEVDESYGPAYVDGIREVLDNLGGPVNNDSEVDYFEAYYPVDRALTEVEQHYLRASLSNYQSADEQAFLAARGIDPTPMSDAEKKVATSEYWEEFLQQQPYYQEALKRLESE